MPFVLDNSVVRGWLLQNQASAYADAIAQRHSLTVNDAVYLDLSLRRQLPVATLNADLADAARAAGVGVAAP